ncbi:MAG: hypothetical protein PHC61_13285 [Chitinivibrionales bacterium]|nr:hypothetical protein [Chitinivibrionales bacterium]
MYEKPQYLTNKGYKRLDKNPYTGKGAAQLKALQAKTKADNAMLTKAQPGASGRSISPKAAMLIASALKVMLKEK